MDRKHFWIRIACTALCFIVLQSVAGNAGGPKKPLKCSAPAYLKPGDKVALITPSYYSPMETALAAADTLRSWGYVPVIGPNVGKLFLEHYAGTVEERLADLRWALNDPDIKAIICLRGGYSTLHLVEGLPLKELAASPKWLIGYSDITTLLSMEACASVMSIHGVMGCNIAKQGNTSVQQSCKLLRDLLEGQVPRYELPAHKENILGRVTGTLVGGNLATFAPLLCSQVNEIGQSDIILFVEEVEELDYIANGDTADLIRIGKYVDRYGLHFADARLSFPDYGDQEIVAKVLLDTLESESASLTYEQSNALYQGVSADYSHLTSKKKRYDAVREDPFFNALQLKYADAITCHKSQGGQWKCVFIDNPFWQDFLTPDDLKWLYTALTRAVEQVYLVNFKDELFQSLQG